MAFLLRFFLEELVYESDVKTHIENVFNHVQNRTTARSAQDQAIRKVLWPLVKQHPHVLFVTPDSEFDQWTYVERSLLPPLWVSRAELKQEGDSHERENPEPPWPFDSFRVVASRALRLSVLGVAQQPEICDVPIRLRLLSAIASKRHEGRWQFELSRDLGVEAKMLFQHLKSFYKYDSIVKFNLALPQHIKRRSNVSGSAIVWLSRFFDLRMIPRDVIQLMYTQQSVPLAQRVLEVLKKVKNNVLMESDLRSLCISFFIQPDNLRLVCSHKTAVKCYRKLRKELVLYHNVSRVKAWCPQSSRFENCLIMLNQQDSKGIATTELGLTGSISPSTMSPYSSRDASSEDDDDDDFDSPSNKLQKPTTRVSVKCESVTPQTFFDNSFKSANGAVLGEESSLEQHNSSIGQQTSPMGQSNNPLGQQNDSSKPLCVATEDAALLGDEGSSMVEGSNVGLLVEGVPISAQIESFLRVAGREGALTTQLSNLIGLPTKRLMRLLQLMENGKKLKRKAQRIGKHYIYRFYSPDVTPASTVPSSTKEKVITSTRDLTTPSQNSTLNPTQSTPLPPHDTSTSGQDTQRLTKNTAVSVLPSFPVPRRRSSPSSVRGRTSYAKIQTEQFTYRQGLLKRFIEEDGACVLPDLAKKFALEEKVKNLDRRTVLRLVDHVMENEPRIARTFLQKGRTSSQPVTIFYWTEKLSEIEAQNVIDKQIFQKRSDGCRDAIKRNLELMASLKQKLHPQIKEAVQPESNSDSNPNLTLVPTADSPRRDPSRDTSRDFCAISNGKESRECFESPPAKRARRGPLETPASGRFEGGESGSPKSEGGEDAGLLSQQVDALSLMTSKIESSKSAQTFDNHQHVLAHVFVERRPEELMPKRVPPRLVYSQRVLAHYGFVFPLMIRLKLLHFHLLSVENLVTIPDVINAMPLETFLRTVGCGYHHELLDEYLRMTTDHSTTISQLPKDVHDALLVPRSTNKPSTFILQASVLSAAPVVRRMLEKLEVLKVVQSIPLSNRITDPLRGESCASRDRASGERAESRSSSEGSPEGSRSSGNEVSFQPVVVSQRWRIERRVTLYKFGNDLKNQTVVGNYNFGSTEEECTDDSKGPLGVQEKKREGDFEKFWNDLRNEVDRWLRYQTSKASVECPKNFQLPIAFSKKNWKGQILFEAKTRNALETFAEDLLKSHHASNDTLGPPTILNPQTPHIQDIAKQLNLPTTAVVRYLSRYIDTVSTHSHSPSPNRTTTVATKAGIIANTVDGSISTADSSAAVPRPFQSRPQQPQLPFVIHMSRDLRYHCHICSTMYSQRPSMALHYQTVHRTPLPEDENLFTFPGVRKPRKEKLEPEDSNPLHRPTRGRNRTSRASRLTRATMAASAAAGEHDNFASPDRHDLKAFAQEGPHTNPDGCGTDGRAIGGRFTDGGGFGNSHAYASEAEALDAYVRRMMVQLKREDEFSYLAVAVIAEKLLLSKRVRERQKERHSNTSCPILVKPIIHEHDFQCRVPSSISDPFWNLFIQLCPPRFGSPSPAQVQALLQFLLEESPSNRNSRLFVHLRKLNAQDFVHCLNKCEIPSFYLTTKSVGITTTTTTTAITFRREKGRLGEGERQEEGDKQREGGVRRGNLLSVLLRIVLLTPLLAYRPKWAVDLTSSIPESEMKRICQFWRKKGFIVPTKSVDGERKSKVTRHLENVCSRKFCLSRFGRLSLFGKAKELCWMVQVQQNITKTLHQVKGSGVPCHLNEPLDGSSCAAHLQLIMENALTNTSSPSNLPLSCGIKYEMHFEGEENPIFPEAEEEDGEESRELLNLLLADQIKDDSTSTWSDDDNESLEGVGDDFNEESSSESNRFSESDQEELLPKLGKIKGRKSTKRNQEEDFFLCDDDMLFAGEGRVLARAIEGGVERHIFDLTPNDKKIDIRLLPMHSSTTSLSTRTGSDVFELLFHGHLSCAEFQQDFGCPHDSDVPDHSSLANRSVALGALMKHRIPLPWRTDDEGFLNLDCVPRYDDDEQSSWSWNLPYQNYCNTVPPLDTTAFTKHLAFSSVPSLRDVVLAALADTAPPKIQTTSYPISHSVLHSTAHSAAQLPTEGGGTHVSASHHALHVPASHGGGTGSRRFRPNLSKVLGRSIPLCLLEIGWPSLERLLKSAMSLCEGQKDAFSKSLCGMVKGIEVVLNDNGQFDISSHFFQMAKIVRLLAYDVELTGNDFEEDDLNQVNEMFKNLLDLLQQIWDLADDSVGLTQSELTTEEGWELLELLGLIFRVPGGEEWRFFPSRDGKTFCVPIRRVISWGSAEGFFEGDSPQQGGELKNPDFEVNFIRPPNVPPYLWALYGPSRCLGWSVFWEQFGKQSTSCDFLSALGQKDFQLLIGRCALYAVLALTLAKRYNSTPSNDHLVASVPDCNKNRSLPFPLKANMTPPSSWVGLDGNLNYPVLGLMLCRVYNLVSEFQGSPAESIAAQFGIFVDRCELDFLLDALERSYYLKRKRLNHNALHYFTTQGGSTRGIRE